MTDRFKGKNALVAGGTGGLGRAVSLAFLREGARIFVTYRSEAEYAALMQAWGERSDALQGFRADVTSETETAQLVRSIGTPDILVNAVGSYAGGLALWQTGLDVFDRMMLLNVRSGFVLARAVAPGMVERGSG